MKNIYSNDQAGITTLMVVAFMAIFLLIMSALVGYAFEEAKYGRALLGREQALHASEAGLEYYRWFLGHNPGIMTNGAGLVSPYTYNVNDPETGTQIGSAVITATPNTQCGVVQSIDLSSTGSSSADPGYPRTISVRYMQPTVAEYGYLLDTNVWFGPGDSVVGPMLSDGGIRMDGTSNSSMSSAVSTWTCNSSLGCSGNQTEPGIFGTGNNSALWNFPVSSVDFTGIATNFNTLMGYAKSDSMYFYNAAVEGRTNAGFHMILNNDGSFDMYEVTATTGFQGYHVDTGTWQTDYDVIASQTYLGHYTPPSNCAVVYVQGMLWLEGTVKGKLTILAADPGSFTPDIILNNNITYAVNDGTTGLTAISEHSIRIPVDSPNNMTTQGIFVADTGYYGRDYYAPGTVSPYNNDVLENQITIEGTVVSTAEPVTCWTSGSSCVSGYNNTVNAYDRVLAFSPPPFTPTISPDYHFVLWKE